METLFVHFNNHTNSGPRKNVSRKLLHSPSYTFAGVLSEDKSAIYVGIAKCSPRDQFVKKLGRAKAEGRAKSLVAPKIIVSPELLEDKKLSSFFAEQCKKLI